jgi:hypothetical protein
MPSNRPEGQATLFVTIPMKQFEFIQSKVESGYAISRQDYIRRMIDRVMELEGFESDGAVKA